MEVLTQVFHVLDPDAQSHQTLVNASGRTRFCRDARVSHRRWVADERFHAAEALRQAEQPRSAEHRAGSRPATPKSHANHAAEVAHLTPGDFVARMLGKARVVHAL